MSKSRFPIATVITLMIALFSPSSFSKENDKSDYDIAKEILKIMEANVITKSSVDWTALRKEIDLMFGSQQNDLLQKSIYRILEVTNTGHSSYYSDTRPKFVMHYTRDCSSHNLVQTPIPSDIGYVEVSSFQGEVEGDDLDFVKYIRHQIKTQYKANMKGWIIDLANNTGGNMWPMLSGIAPLLEDGVHGYFTHTDGSKSSWSSQDGSTYMNQELMIGLEDNLNIKKELPIAVISSQMTASAGKAVLLSFKGKKNVKTFGKDSCGMSTANKRFDLTNGDILVVTTSTMMDSFANEYGQVVKVDFQTDEPFKEASAWIASF